MAQVVRQGVRAAFAPGDYRRLTGLKARHDPHVLFQCNHAIPPLRDQG